MDSPTHASPDPQTPAAAAAPVPQKKRGNPKLSEQMKASHARRRAEKVELERLRAMKQEWDVRQEELETLRAMALPKKEDPKMVKPPADDEDGASSGDERGYQKRPPAKKRPPPQAPPQAPANPYLAMLLRR